MQESVSRIQAALRNSGYRWPGPKVTINLAPADVKKDADPPWRDFADPDAYRDGQESDKRAVTVAAAGHHNPAGNRPAGQRGNRVRRPLPVPTRLPGMQRRPGTHRWAVPGKAACPLWALESVLRTRALVRVQVAVLRR